MDRERRWEGVGAVFGVVLGVKPSDFRFERRVRGQFLCPPHLDPLPRRGEENSTAQIGKVESSVTGQTNGRLGLD